MLSWRIVLHHTHTHTRALLQAEKEKLESTDRALKKLQKKLRDEEMRMFIGDQVCALVASKPLSPAFAPCSPPQVRSPQAAASQQCHRVTTTTANAQDGDDLRGGAGAGAGAQLADRPGAAAAGRRVEAQGPVVQGSMAGGSESSGSESDSDAGTDSDAEVTAATSLTTMVVARAPSPTVMYWMTRATMTFKQCVWHHTCTLHDSG